MSLSQLPLVQSRAVFLSLAVFLNACASDEQTELKEWMKQQRSKTPATIASVVAPIAFVPSPYRQFAGADPFDEQRLKNSLIASSKAVNQGVARPDATRKRELLEGFSIDSVKMVGFVFKQGKPSGLVSAAGVLYSVSAGQYIGQDFGRVVAVSEQEISIKELVQDASGVWIERTSKLPLSVASKEIKK